jgi:hypothetical protein
MAIETFLLPKTRGTCNIIFEKQSSLNHAFLGNEKILIDIQWQGCQMVIKKVRSTSDTPSLSNGDKV